MASLLDSTVAQLEAMVDHCTQANDRSGYFGAMYLAVTREVRDRCRRGDFDDVERMERFVVEFADRYIVARRSWLDNEPTSVAWQLAFESAQRRQPLIVQHLALGMSAHINLDLGVTVARLAQTDGTGVQPLRADFNAINDVLVALVDRCENAVAVASPWLQWGDRVARRVDEHMVSASLVVARRQAWSLSERLAGLTGPEYDNTVRSADRTTRLLSERLLRPGRWSRIVVWIVRQRERRNPCEVIALLRNA